MTNCSSLQVFQNKIKKLGITCSDSGSVGDSTAEKIGVVATPEVSIVQLTPNHLFFVVASDGVFEFLSSQAVVNMVCNLTHNILLKDLLPSSVKGINHGLIILKLFCPLIYQLLPVAD